MIENRTLRLGQVSRKLNVGRNTIINFLKEKGYNVNSNPNAKINSEQYTLLENVFKDSAVEKKVASNIKIGIEEKLQIVEEKPKIVEEKPKVEEKKGIKIVDKINLKDSSRKKVASSDQSKKKRRPRKRIIPDKKNTKTKDIKKTDKDTSEQKNK